MQRLFILIFACLSLVLSGCDCEGVLDNDGGMTGDGMVDGEAGVDSGTPMCDPTDTDGDGIADIIEGTSDPDGDGIPSSMDDDSDGDGIPDSMETGMSVCTPTDSDGDGTPDFLDLDSDNDGLSDARESMLGTDSTNIDSDGDGVTDLGEVEGSMTDPLDNTSTIPATDFFVVLPYNGERANRTLRFGTNIAIADVFFLVDMTGSMGGERTNLINGLVDTIIPGIQAAIPDVYFGAAGFDDYPVGGYGGGNDLPFYLLRQIGAPDEDLGAWSISASATSCPSNSATNDIGTITGMPNGVSDILEAVQGLPCHGGGDGPESYVPALYSTASGMGLTWSGGSVPDAMCPDGTRGYPCFRSGSLPIVLLFGDYSFHNGPMGEDSYSAIPEAPTYSDALMSLTSIGARVIGITSGSQATAHFNRIATDTGTVDIMMSPLVFNISSNGSGLDTAVVNAVTSLANGTPQDVSTRTDNVVGNPDEFDAAMFVKSIVPVEGYADCTGMTCATMGEMPGVTYTSKDTTTFYGVIPGVQVEFAIDFWNDVRMGAEAAQIFRAKIVVLGNGVAELDSRNVYIVVPPEGQTVTLI